MTTNDPQNVPHEDAATKSRFLASAIHEIRTPIQTIIGTLELLDETVLNTEQTEYVRQIQFSADVLLSLVNDILDFSKIKSGKFNIENIPFIVPDLVEKVVDLVSIDSHNRGLEIITDIDYNLMTPTISDPTRVQQILLNLVKNAVKFTAKGYVRVVLQKVTDKELHETEYFKFSQEPTKHIKKSKQDGWLLFSVYDSGIGVTPEVQQKIFTDYYQGDASMSRKYGGTGLGLSISKNLANLMNGYIGMKPNPDGGSIFAFALPYIIGDDKDSLSILEKTASEAYPIIPEDAKILVVDDNELARKSIREKLAFFDAKQITLAASGQEALEKMREASKKGSPFTLALIDMIMPSMDGWRLSAEINADKTINGARLYLIVPEGQMGGDAKMKMLDWFNGYLYKPIKRAMLVDLLNDTFNAPIDLELVDNTDTSDTIEISPSTIDIESMYRVKQGLPTSLEKLIHPQSDLEQHKTPENSFVDTKQIPDFHEEEDLPGTGHTVLIAEDHPVNQKILRTFLEKLGTFVYAASNGQEAVSLGLEHPEIELIFMDIQMPIMNGVDATIELRKKGFSGTIIACTANTDEEDFSLYHKTGMEDILIKPFKKTNVKSFLEKWIKPIEHTECIWHPEELLYNLDNDKQLFVSLIDQYIKETTNGYAQAAQEFSKRNYSSLSQTAHRLKGSSSSITARRLEQIAKQIEKKAKDENFDISVLLHDFESAFIDFKTATEKWLKAHNDDCI